MLLDQARQTLEDAIEAHCRGSYCSPEKDAALARLVDDKPCILNTGSYHNAKAGLAASVANAKGDEAFLDYLKWQMETYSGDDAPYFINSAILDHLVGVNEAGSKLITRARKQYFAPKLTAELARELIDYNPLTGQIFRRTNPDKEAGYVNSVTGRRFIRIAGESVLVHRLAWLITYGEFPEAGIDHRDGDPLNNRLSNLRLASQAQNTQNKRRYRNNKSGRIGVSPRPNGKWCAQIQVDRKGRHLGYFDTIEEAAAAYQAAKKELHMFQPALREGVM